jgi:hypothetical protein
MPYTTEHTLIKVINPVYNVGAPENGVLLHPQSGQMHFQTACLVGLKKHAKLLSGHDILGPSGGGGGATPESAIDSNFRPATCK